MHVQSRVWKLTEANEELPELKKRVKGLEEEEGELQAKLGELEQSSQQEREEHERTVEEMRQNHEEATTVSKVSAGTKILLACTMSYIYMYACICICICTCRYNVT